MTVPYLPELRRLLAEATPGPWRCYYYAAEEETAHFAESIRLSVESDAKVGATAWRVTTDQADPEHWLNLAYGGNGSTSRANTVLIAALRNDAPAILDLLDDMAAALLNVERHKGLLGGEREPLARYRAMCGEP